MHAGIPTLGPAHMQAPGGEVDVIPAQCHSLRRSEAVAVGNQEGRGVPMPGAVLLGGLDEPLDLSLVSGWFDRVIQRRPLVSCRDWRPLAAERVTTATLIAVEIVRKNPDQIGFAVNPRRWVVERFFAWIGRNRRLAKDFEATIDSARAFLYAASVMLLVRRIARAS